MKYLVMVLGGLLLFGLSLKAQSVPNPQYAVGVFGSDGNGGFNQSISTVGAVNYSSPEFGTAPITGDGFTSGGTSPEAGVYGSINASAYSAVSFNATAVITYYMYIHAPVGNAGDPVTIDFSGSISGNATIIHSSSPPFYSEMATSSIVVADNLTDIQHNVDTYYLGNSAGGSRPASYDQNVDSGTFSANSGQSYVIQLSAAVYLNGTIEPESSVNVTGGALADPTFTLDPTETGEGYSLSFSPGIGPVPEPSTLTLLVAGAGVAAFLIKRKS